MAYEPTVWKNREVERPRTFTMQNNDDGTITLIPAEGTVNEQGTPIVAENLNKIENELVKQDKIVTTHLEEKASKTSYGHTKIGAGIDVATDGVISVPDASTSKKGIAQLNDTLTSTSTVQAATANSVKQVNDKFKLPVAINAVLATGWTNNDSNHMNLTYYKDTFGVVHLSGLVRRTASAGVTIMTLPVGYRPSKLMFWVTTVGLAPAIVGNVTINNVGTVTFSATNEGAVPIDISFRTD